MWGIVENEDFDLNMFKGGILHFTERLFRIKMLIFEGRRNTLATLPDSSCSTVLRDPTIDSLTCTIFFTTNKNIIISFNRIYYIKYISKHLKGRYEETFPSVTPLWEFLWSIKQCKFCVSGCVVIEKVMRERPYALYNAFFGPVAELELFELQNFFSQAESPLM